MDKLARTRGRLRSAMQRWALGWACLCTLLAGAAHAGEWQYQVRRAENLWTISETHLTGVRWVRPLQRLNGVRDPLYLVPGGELRVPLAWTRRTATAAGIDI